MCQKLQNQNSIPAYAAGYSDGLQQGEQIQAAHVENLERKIALVMQHDSNLIDHLELYVGTKP